MSKASPHPKAASDGLRIADDDDRFSTLESM